MVQHPSTGTGITFGSGITLKISAGKEPGTHTNKGDTIDRRSRSQTRCTKDRVKIIARGKQRDAPSSSTALSSASVFFFLLAFLRSFSSTRAAGLRLPPLLPLLLVHFLDPLISLAFTLGVRTLAPFLLSSVGIHLEIAFRAEEGR